ncbi:hypothetical protein BLNAU_14973 [Blattamonas nauphoetae]|uniref:Uncharacterized protein n=1 Tax=Blattamonas nauphoetae TaxID=2049346 RepID=A0ABQ9XIE7_9EUKA|nr:hypothetical protein BLNAU_14973 [Blattamonas nauphoetae]
MLLLTFIFTAHSIIDVSTLLNRRSNSDNTVLLGMEKHGSHNHDVRDETVSILGSGLTPMTGLLADTAYLFDMVNTSLTLGNLDLSVSSRYRIAELDSESTLSVLGSTIDLDEEYSPFLTNGGSIRLVDIALRGSSILPELVYSTNVDTHVIGSEITSDGVTVGTSPLFGASSYSVELTHSSFSNIDHVVPNQYNPYQKSQCLKESDFPSFDARTNFAFSKMRNVTDDIYGAITEASLVGDSFVYNTLRSEQQFVKIDVLQANKQYKESVACTAVSDYTVKGFEFDNINASESLPLAGLMFSSLGNVKMTVLSCSFSNINLRDAMVGLMISGNPDPKSSDSSQLIVKDCKYTNCSGVTLFYVMLPYTTIEISNLAMKSCSSYTGCVYLMGSSPDKFSKEGLTFRGCSFENSFSSMESPQMSIMQVLYGGTITLCEQTTFKHCTATYTSMMLMGVTVNIKQTRFVNCSTAYSRAAAGVAVGFKVFVEDVLIQHCKALSSPNGLLISLYYNESIFNELSNVNEEQDYAMKNSYIERDTEDDNSNLDVLFSMPESLLPGGKLDPAKFSKVNSNTGTNTVGSTSADLNSKPESTPEIADESSTVSQKGDDPRTDKKKKDASSSGGGASTGVIVTIVVVVVVVVVLVVVGIIVAVLLVRHNKKKNNKPSDNSKPVSSRKEEMSAPNTRNERSEGVRVIL